VKYETKYKKNVFTLTFDSLLDANTTYTLSFRESIVDLTEGNPAEKLQLAFSTGDQLDTLQLTGSVSHALYEDPVPETTVVLYRTSDTTNIFNGLPYYFTETLDSGKYTFNNLKSGYYRIYAFNDYNGNLKVESDSEPYAYIKDSLYIGQENTPQHLRLVNLNIDSLKIFSSRRSGSNFSIKLNKVPVEFNVSGTDSVVGYLDFEDPSLIRVQSVNPINANDSTAIKFTAKDSIDYTVELSAYASFDPESRRKQPFQVRINDQPVIVKNRRLAYNLVFTKPANILNPDSTFIQVDSLIRYSLDSMSYTWNDNHTQLDLEYTFDRSLFQRQPDTVIERTSGKRSRPFKPYFQVADHAFISLENDTIESRDTQIQFYTESNVSTFILELSNVPEHNILLQFLNSDNEIILTRTVTNSGNYTFNNINPDSYQIRIIYDENNNGVWDPGNFFTYDQPEYVTYLRDQSGEKEWSLRANFEYAESIDLAR
jgi:uncharacterized protein (DUF2141 family)